jgi:putative addiction module killer protein
MSLRLTIEVRRYQGIDGTVPLTQWLAGLRDLKARASLEIRFQRVALGVLGDTRPVGAGVIELRVHLGPGYRAYCARYGTALVILLCGGDKRTQDADIKRAKGYWTDWKLRNK